MAQYDEEVVLKITTNYATAVNEIVRLTNELGKLKADMAGVRQAQKDGSISSDEANKKLEALNAEYRKLNASVRSYRKEIDANLEAEEAQSGSLKEMRAQLKNLLKEYDALSQTDREAIGGVGEEKLLEIRRLQEELRNAEEASGRFQRSVGSYEDAIKRALSGTVPLKTALKDLKTEIQQLSIQYKAMNGEIDAQRAKLQQLGATVGTDSQEYKEQEQVLNDLQKKYNETGDAINKMSLAAGEISDTIGDTNASIANFGKDNANMKAVAEGMGVLANSYQVAKAGMAAFGMESEAMIEIWAKMQVIQQGVAALNQILIALEKESVLRQQLHVVVNKLLGKTIQQTAAAKTEDAAASAAAAAGDTALAAGETAATAAAGGLVTALKAVGAAIKSIPIIGWIAGAVAILGTLTALVIKHNKAEKVNNQTLQQRKALMREINEVEKESLESVQKNVVAMEANVRRLKEAEVGTREWSNLVKEVAGDLGVTEEWLQKNVDKVDELKDAWVNMQIAMAKGEAYAKKIADNEIKIATAEAEIARIMADEKYKDRAEAISKELGVSVKAAKALVEADHKLKKNDTSSNFATYANAKNAIIEEIQTQNKALMDGLDEAYKQQVEASEELAEIAGDGIKETGNKVRKEAASVKTDVTKTAKELSEELENLMVEGMADGLEKNIKQVELAAERYIEKMKEARDKDAENKEKYDAIILQYEKNTQDKIRKMREDGYKLILEGSAKITESYNNLWSSNAPNSFYNFVNQINQIAKNVSDEVNNINSSIRELEAQVKAYKETISSETRIEADNKALADELQGQIKDRLPEIKVPVKPEIVVDNERIYKAANQLGDELKYYGFDNDVIAEYEVKWLESLEKIRQKVLNTGKDLHTVIDEVATTIKEDIGLEIVFDNAYSVFIDVNEGVLDDLEQYSKDLAAYNKRVAENSRIDKKNAEITEQQTKAEEEAANARERMDEATRKLNEAENELLKAESNYQSKLGENILVNRQMNKSLREYAKTIQQVLLEQAKLGNIDIIPDNFGVYIDYQIDKLEEEISKSYGKLERMAAKTQTGERTGPNSNKGVVGEGVNTEYIEESQRYSELKTRLEELKETRKSVSKDLLADNSQGGFFNNKELAENAENISRLAAQISVLEKVMQQGLATESEISAVEAENDELYQTRLGLVMEIAEADNDAAKAAKEKELAEIDAHIQSNVELVANHKEMLALMGYTTEEEMRQLLESLKKQEKAFSDQTDVIMKKTAASVVQSIGTIANSLLDLMNAIGEDNAEMANFLEGVAYMQIGVNMAVGVSEAIAAGSGVPFPGNLAAIAAGVAAVVSGIASAISTYKQYHKQVSSPRFAEGGYVSGEKGVDKIPAWLSDGEYVIKRKRVKELGVPFLDALNQGKSVVGRTHFAEGGYVNSNITNIVMNEEMRSMMIDAMNEIQPVVSVKEITNVQNKVRAKESVARK